MKNRIEWLLFAMAFIAFAYFHQGGGWNANSRFAMVRAVVEQGRLNIDSYLIYSLPVEPGDDFHRIDIQNAEYEQDGLTNVLVWKDRSGQAFPINGKADDDEPRVKFVDLKAVAATGDVAYFNGHFYPNKSPGGSIIAIPAYWLLYHAEHLIGRNPDTWWILTLNAWLTSAFSVGLLSAVGVVLFYGFARDFAGGKTATAVVAAIAFGFGTMFFPYATCMYEHNIVAVCLLASFYFLYRVKTNSAGSAPRTLWVAGLSAGCAAITNYIVVFAVILLGLYLLISVRRSRGWFWFGLGLLGPFLLVCVYNQICFGTPFTTNYRHENPYFRNANALLEVFVMPRWGVFVALLFSPFRGLFFSSPVLILGAAGLFYFFKNKNLRSEAWLIIAMVAFFLLLNTSFEAWEGGWTVAPRYLGPAVPFVALGLTTVFDRFFRTAWLVSAISILIMLLVAAVDPQPPIGVSDTAQVLGRSPWRYNPLTEYELPIFFRGRPWPLIRAQQARVEQLYETQLTQTNLTPAEQQAELKRFHDHIETLVSRGEPAPIAIRCDDEASQSNCAVLMSDTPAIIGPVSVNQGGIYGGGLLDPERLRWNSFNAGEFVFPESRWSLLPLFIVGAAAGWVVFRSTRRANIHSLS